MVTVNFKEKIGVRITTLEKKKIIKVCKKNKETYNNPSHFIRSAILKKLRDYDSKGKLIEQPSLVYTNKKGVEYIFN